MRIAAALLLAALCAAVPARADAPSGAVTVLFPGSLVWPMADVKAGLASQGIDLQGEAGGSTLLEGLIASGARTPDVFVSMNRDLVNKLGDRVASATTFATTALGMGWSGSSNYAYAFEGAAKGEMPLLVALAQPGLRIGRTDPRKDPKGQMTIDALVQLLGADNEKHVLGPDTNPAQLYPEQELVALVEAGQLDVGFMLANEAKARSFEFVPFPGEDSMSDKLTFTIAIMKDAAHPAAAKAFVDYILTGEGRAILERNGLRYLQQPASTPAAGSR